MCLQHVNLHLDPFQHFDNLNDSAVSIITLSSRAKALGVCTLISTCVPMLCINAYSFHTTAAGGLLRSDEARRGPQSTFSFCLSTLCQPAEGDLQPADIPKGSYALYPSLYANMRTHCQVKLKSNGTTTKYVNLHAGMTCTFQDFFIPSCSRVYMKIFLCQVITDFFLDLFKKKSSPLRCPMNSLASTNIHLGLR